MPFTDIFSDLFSSLSFTEAHAEAPPAQEDSEDQGEEESKDDEGENEDSGDEESGGDNGREDEEEEEEEEEEPVDIKPKLEEECARSSQCAPLKHHYDACAERVQQQHENENHKGPKEDCVEEFFHLSHCATQCAAPKLFRALK